MTAIFTWKAESTSSGGGEFATFKSEFGDGYSQELPNGINNEKQKWTVVVSGYEDDIDACLAFIRARMGSTSFFWTPPRGSQGYYRCKKYTGPIAQGGGYFVLTLEFEQNYQP